MFESFDTLYLFKTYFVFQNIKGISLPTFETNLKKIIEIIFPPINNCYVLGQLQDLLLKYRKKLHKQLENNF